MVMILIVSLAVEFELFKRWKHANVVKAFFKIGESNVASLVQVENAECFVEIEVRSLSQCNLGVLKFFLKRNLLS